MTSRPTYRNMSDHSNTGPPLRSSGLSLYANLLDPNAPTTAASVSRGPVVFKTGGAQETTDEAAKKPQIDAGRLPPCTSHRCNCNADVCPPLTSYPAVPTNKKTSAATEVKAEDNIPQTFHSRHHRPKQPICSSSSFGPSCGVNCNQTSPKEYFG